MASIDTPQAAMRLARAITSDISLYNEQKIIQALQNDSLFQDLAAEIEEGRNLYRSRVAPNLLETGNYFDRAVVDVIVKSKGHIKSRIW
jgi:hypothetical protein